MLSWLYALEVQNYALILTMYYYYVIHIEREVDSDIDICIFATGNILLTIHNLLYCRLKSLNKPSIYRKLTGNGKIFVC